MTRGGREQKFGGILLRGRGESNDGGLSRRGRKAHGDHFPENRVCIQMSES